MGTDEQFANLDNWSICDDFEQWTTILKTANVELIPGGGVRLKASNVAEGSGLYPGAQIFTNATVQYGFIEVRCKVAEGRQGAWSCPWLYNLPLEDYALQDKEIDIMEYFGGVNNYEYGVFNSTVKTGDNYVAGDDLPAAYHYYAIDWRADKIIFFYDDKVYSVNANVAAFQTPMRIYLWNGVTANPSPPESWPNQFDVDYVRVWQRAA